VGDPVGRGGGLWARHDGTALKLFSVTDDGDTTIWVSAKSGDAIGGNYEVTGGVSKGLGGTWRARLVSGPPATREALLGAQRGAALLPLEAVWPALLFFLLLGACVRWVLTAPTPHAEALRDPFGIGETSVGGWLALFAFGQVVGIAMVAYECRNLLDFLGNGTWELGAAVPGLRGVVVVEKLVTITRLVAMIVGLRLIMIRSRYAPRFWFAYLVLVAAYLLADQAAAPWLESQSRAVAGPPRSDGFDATSTRPHLSGLQSTVVLLLWSWYWCNSARVRARFGLGALDKPEPLSPGPDAALTG
jgi:hypothetical protein